jgi:hypothetical protein
MDNVAASPLVLAGVVQKRTVLAGEAEHLARQLDRLRADLAHLDAAIRIPCPKPGPS